MTDDLFRKLTASYFDSLTRDLIVSPSLFAKLPVREPSSAFSIPLIVSDAVPPGEAYFVKRRDYEWTMPKYEFESFVEPAGMRYRVTAEMPKFPHVMRIMLPTDLCDVDWTPKKRSRRQKRKLAVKMALLARVKRMAARSRQ